MPFLLEMQEGMGEERDQRMVVGAKQSVVVVRNTAAPVETGVTSGQALTHFTWICSGPSQADVPLVPAVRAAPNSAEYFLHAFTIPTLAFR